MSLQRLAILYDQQRYDLAAEEAERILSANPDDAQALAMLSLAHTRQGKYEDATYEAKAAMGAQPDLALPHFAHAQALMYRNRFSEARQAAGQAIYLEPDNPQNYALLGYVELESRKWQAAYDAAAQGLSIEPNHGQLLRVRSLAAVQLGLLDEAQSAVSASLSAEIRPGTIAALGYQQMQSGQFREARATFANALRMEPTNKLARFGLVETIKATNVVYRTVLRYLLFMSRLSGPVLLVLLFGAPILFRLVGQTLNSNPATSGLVMPFVALWLAFILTSWLAMPLSNLLLMFHPLGRHALAADEWSAAVVTGTLLGVALAGLVGFFAGLQAGLYLAVTMAAAALPASAIWYAEFGWPRWVLGAFAAVAIATGVTAAALAISFPAGSESSPPAAFWVSVGISVVSTWAAQFLVRVQPAR
jgi:tetratricopeptide (TPR) repeat protein